MIHNFDKRLQYIKNAYDKYLTMKDNLNTNFNCHSFTGDPMLKDIEFLTFYSMVINAYYDGYSQGKQDQIYSNQTG